jgi:hypothetical protein
MRGGQAAKQGRGAADRSQYGETASQALPLHRTMDKKAPLPKIAAQAQGRRARPPTAHF